MWSDRIVPIALLSAYLASTPAVAEQPHYAIGRAPTPAEIAAWDIDVRADGKGLPKGRGGVEQGKEIYAARCAACHGDKGQGGEAEALVGGLGTLTKPNPIRTIGSYWPYATTVFDFVRRAMPFNAPQSLSNDEVYAVSAYLLHLNGLVPATAVLDATSLPQIMMPNRHGFIGPDPRPDVPPP
jgi:mono/diheme cytochrome c family protein